MSDPHPSATQGDPLSLALSSIDDRDIVEAAEAAGIDLEAEACTMRNKFLARLAGAQAQAESESESEVGGCPPTLRESRGAPPEGIAVDIDGDPLPRMIGRYPIRERLGAGGMGVVYGAYDASLDRRLAIKVLNDRAWSASSRRHRRLLREAQAMAKLSHPNLITVHEVGKTRTGQLFVAMEFVPGPTLERWQLLAPRSWRQVTEVFGQIAAGLAALHDAGLVHRDVKPANVIIGDDGRVRVLDLGLVGIDPREFGSTDDGSPEASSSLARGALLTKTGDKIGTPAFMSPEQFRGERLTPASDMFSCCVALYEALYGVHPFMADTLDELRDNVLHCRIAPAPQPNAVPAWLHALVVRGLDVDPSRRPASMDELAEALANDPRQTRMRRIRSVAFVACAGVAGVFFARPEVEPAPICAEGQPMAAAIWNPERAAEVHEAMVDTGLDYAPALADRVIAALDDYTEAWAVSYDWTCSVRSSGAQPAVVDARMACLDNRRTALELSVNILANADAGVVEHAGTMVAELPRVAACNEPDPLVGHEPVPVDPAAAERVIELETRLTEAEVLAHAGRLEDAVALARDVSEAADELGRDELVVRGLLTETGPMIAARGPRPGDAGRLERALVLAIESQLDALAADAMTRLLYVRGLTGHSAAALDDAAIAAAMVERAGDRPELRALMLNNLGAINLAAGNRGEARAAFEQSLELHIGLLGAGHLDLTPTLANLAILAPDADSREQLLKRLLVIFDRQLGPTHPRTLDARLFSSLLHEDPVEVSARLARLCSELHDLDTRELAVDCEIERARRAYARGNLELTHRAAQSARARMSEGDPRLSFVDAYLGLTATPSAAQLDALRATLDESLAIQSSDWWLLLQRGEARLLLGSLLVATGEREAALEQFHGAIEALESIGDDATTLDRDWLLALARSRAASLNASLGGANAELELIRTQAAAARAYFARWPDAYELRLVELDVID